MRTGSQFNIRVGKNPSLIYSEGMKAPNNDQQQSGGNIPKGIEKAIQRLLKPLARLMLSFQITYPVLQEWLKKALVEVADKEFPLADKPQTDTRISLLTGIHRKDIKRLRHGDDNSQQPPESVSIGVQIAAHWQGHSEFQDNNGHPKALPFKDKQGEASFEGLVEQVCKKDIRARVVLDEWLRLGIVELVSPAEELIRLKPGAFVPDQGLEEKAFFLGMNVADHLAAATSNVRVDQSSMFERCMFYDGLSQQSIDELKQLAEQQGMETLKTLNKRALELKQQDQDEGHQHRINVGMYVFNEEAEDNASD